MSDAGDLFRAGKLREAAAAAADDVRRNPADVRRRGLLAELLCLLGQLERADKHLEALGRQDPDSAVGVSLFRQLVRAEQARRDFHEQGRPPELLDQPDRRLQLHLEASIAIREGRLKEARDALEEAERLRPHPRGQCGNRAFDDLRDLDDLTASLLEVLTSTGKYYWVPMERVARMEFRPPARPRDLLWRRVALTVRDGPEGEVFLPTIYAATFEQPNDQLLLGRRTEWLEQPDAPVRGLGQRTWLIGDEAFELLSLSEIDFRAPGEDRGDA